MDAVVLLARRIARPVVCFDLEHTGGKKEVRGITDLGLVVISPEGERTDVSQLVKPGAHCVFEPYVSRLTGIWPSTVSKAPAWPEVMRQQVLPLQDALWVGFNSRTCDMPILRESCRQEQVTFEPMLHLDLMRDVSTALSGSLSVRVKSVYPDVDTTGAHRACFDADLTLRLLVHHLERNEITDAMWQGNLSKKAKAALAPPSESGPHSFLTEGVNTRQGAPWLPGEAQWVVAQYGAAEDKEAALKDIALRTGRSPRAIRFALEKVGIKAACDSLAA